MEKWNLPPEAPPFWLDPGTEIIPNPPPMRDADFVIKCIESFPRLDDLSLVQIIDVVANTVVETGWGKHRKGNNLGGWKITKGAAGPGVPWFRARGNKTSGDPPWCYYRVFSSFEDFFAQWMTRFVPRDAGANHRYRQCGDEFWAGYPWFDDLIAAGYKGENTKASPERSIEGHSQISEKIAKMYTQHLLGELTVDGDWGSKSTARAESLLGEGAWSSELFAAVVHSVNPGALITPSRGDSPAS